MVVADPFFLDLSVWSGIFILFCLIALAVFMFFRRSFTSTGLLCIFIGFLLLYNDINFLIAGISFFIGFLMIFGGGKK